MQSEHIAFNFDLVNNLGYCKEIKEKSPDAIFVRNDVIYFVEFKSGSWEKNELRLKIHEGLTTLYHFATKNNIINRDDFFEIPFHYIVVTAKAKNAKEQKQTSAFLSTLQLSRTYFGLANLEGFLIKRASLLTEPNLIYETLREISDNSISEMTIECPVSGECHFKAAEPTVH